MLKQISFLLIFFLISFLTLQGQDWQTVRSGRIAYFDNDQGWIKCIRIDSVKFDKDSVLYPMSNIQQLYTNCYTPEGISWLGKKVIIQSDGVNLFFNHYNDTIRINTRARVGESWTIFQIEDFIKITAEVKSAEMQSILGETDSIKTIGFKVYQQNVLKEHHYLSDKTLLISKNHGFIGMMNFRVFPEEPATPSFEILMVYHLIGMTNPDLGEQNLTWLRVHDYQVDDELHIVSNSWNWSVNPGYRYELKTIWKFLERKESKDSVFYRIERKELLKKAIERWDNISYTFTHDTITQVYRPDSLFDKLPEEPIISDNGADANMMFKDGPFIKKITTYLPIRKSFEYSCWYPLIFDGGGPGDYLKGLGGPYYVWNEIISGDERALVYYKKGSTTWGTPLVITAVDRLETEDEILVYPNPASDFVTLENRSSREEKYMVSLTDMQGKEVFKKETEITTTYKLDISSIKEGAYLLKMQNGKTEFSKVIIKKP